MSTTSVIERMNHLEAAFEELRARLQGNMLEGTKALDTVSGNVGEHLGDLQAQVDELRTQVQGVEAAVLLGFEAILEAFDEVGESPEAVVAADWKIRETLKLALGALGQEGREELDG